MEAQHTNDKGGFFWSGNTLMQNEPGTYGSTHVLQIDESRISLSNEHRNVIEASMDMFKTLKKCQLALFEVEIHYLPPHVRELIEEAKESLQLTHKKIAGQS